MEPVIELRGSKIVRGWFAAMAWFFGIIAALIAVVWVSGQAGSPPPSSPLIAIGICMLGAFTGMLRGDEAICTVRLQGKRLSLQQGRIRKTSWEIDTDQVVALWGSIGNLGGNPFKRLYVLNLILQDGSRVALYPVWIPRAERLKLYPLVAELIERPTVGLYGYINEVTKSWFGPGYPQTQREIQRGRLPRWKRTLR